MAFNMRYVELAKQLHPRLQRFFAKYPPNQILPISTRTNTIKDGATPNPFLPHKHPVTGKWHDPEFSLRRQAELVKLARGEGVEELLPFTSKGTEERIRHRVEHGLRDGEEERSYAGEEQVEQVSTIDEQASNSSPFIDYVTKQMPPTISRTSAEPTLYEILSLTQKRLESQESATQRKAIKQAYHKALLKHHPDKKPQDSPITPSPPQAPRSPKIQSKSGGGKSSSVPKSQLTYTIDQIQHAYNVLSDARQRREYDRQLLLTSSSSSTYSASFSSSSAEQKHSVSTRFHTGVETVDLDDLGFDERSGVYFGSCRCGNERGFQFTEEQLEEYEEDLVLMMQCLDCSLWMRVLFDAAAQSEDEQQQHSSNHRHHTNTEAGETVVANQSRDATERRAATALAKAGRVGNST
ncbi:hypothetical protein E0Z10_g749 [Xylaria hypoxylon]|uniref:Diphthamide biosynthesis protein 4 n=1 Tax=Xylaria hypoxylon TaxID=37992 RepID=A0A4Z0Z8S6_9PEZI|nr:hypothetical protein E0Z10_g749 [Xylaria hypoxylon]